MFFRLMASILIAGFLGGCASQFQPTKAYEGEHPHSDTAVFIAFDNRLELGHVEMILSIDQKDINSWVTGYPSWVRVLPGTHQFLIKHTFNHAGGLSYYKYNFVELPIEIPDMKPRHVYVARYKVLGERVFINIEDLGENPDYGITMGFPRRYYRVTF